MEARRVLLVPGKGSSDLAASWPWAKQGKGRCWREGQAAELLAQDPLLAGEKGSPLKMMLKTSPTLSSNNMALRSPFLDTLDHQVWGAGESGLLLLLLLLVRCQL